MVEHAQLSNSHSEKLRQAQKYGKFSFSESKFFWYYDLSCQRTRNFGCDFPILSLSGDIWIPARTRPELPRRIADYLTESAGKMVAVTKTSF